MLVLALWLSLMCVSVALSVPSVRPPTMPPTPSPADCAGGCAAQEHCVDGSCECLPGYRRDSSNVCIRVQDHIDTSHVPSQIQAKVSSLTFQFEVTTVASRDLVCELLTDPNTGHYKYGTTTISLSGVITREPVSLTLLLDNHITEDIALLSCFLTPPKGTYTQRTTLEILTLQVLGASGIYDDVDTSTLPIWILPSEIGTTLSVSLGASAKGPRDLHLDLVLTPAEGERDGAHGKLGIPGVLAKRPYNFTLQISATLVLGAKAFWSAYLTPPNLTYHDIVPGGFGDKVMVTIGTGPPPTSMPSATPTAPTNPTTQFPTPPTAPTSSPTKSPGWTASPTVTPELPPSAAPTQTSDSNIPDPRPGETFPVEWIIVIVVVIVIVLIVLVLTWYNQKRKRTRAFQNMAVNVEESLSGDYAEAAGNMR